MRVSSLCFSCSSSAISCSFQFLIRRGAGGYNLVVKQLIYSLFGKVLSCCNFPGGTWVIMYCTSVSVGCHCERNVKPECALEGYKYDCWWWNASCGISGARHSSGCNNVAGGLINSHPNIHVQNTVCVHVSLAQHQLQTFFSQAIPLG